MLSFNGRLRVWRMHNERYDVRCIKGSVKHDVKINVWGAFCGHGVGRLRLIDGIMDKDIYLDILEEPMLHSADLLFGREIWLFQHDNDPKHTALCVKEWMVDNDVPLMPWPAQSLDLNPIENLWTILDRKACGRQVNSKQQLFECLEKAWCEQTLVDSMPSRCQAVIDSNGMPTKY